VISSSESIRSFPRSEDPFNPRCHNCGSTDHLRNQCPKPQPPLSPKDQRAPQSPFRPRGPFQKPPSYAAFKPTSPRREPPRCFICNKTGHIARDCRSKFTVATEYHGYYRTSPQQNYIQQQKYPQFTVTDDLEEPNLEEVAAATTSDPQIVIWDTSTIRTREDHHTTSVNA